MERETWPIFYDRCNFDRSVKGIYGIQHDLLNAQLKGCGFTNVALGLVFHI